MPGESFALTVEMVERLRSLALTSALPGMRGTLATSNYYGQGYVDVPAMWLLEIIDRMDRSGLPLE